jgi:signal transduction histidine kinase
LSASSPGGSKPRLRRRTFWRVYLHGIVLLVLVGVALALTARGLEGTPNWKMTGNRLAAYVASHLEPALDDPERLEVELQRLATAFEASPAIYRGDGSLVAGVGDHLPEAEAAMPLALDMRHDRRVMRYLVPLRHADGGTYLVVEGPTPHGLRSLTFILVVVLGVVALVSIPLARAIARPLERLTAVVRRFGGGDRTARSGLVRTDEVGALAAAFDEMADRIDRLLQRDRELMANVSHELKTPLARLRVALELCEPPPEGEGDDAPDAAVSLAELRERLHGMSGDLAELERLVEDVMVMARLDLAEEGDQPRAVVLRKQPLELADVLEESRARFERHSSDRRLLFEPGTEPCSIDGDPALLRRVFDNLLDNAAKYSEQEAGPIEIEMGSEEGWYVVDVCDRGVGVDPDDLPRLFEPFFRADRSRTRGTGGSGIGLAFCASVVRAHDGEIEAHSRDGGGLIARVRLPKADHPA